ncbi:MAG TPA: cation diffusion facilitator family transporter [Planktothrix sp.]|jgi:cobalt-zinc-cadmium efflux system protein
MHIHFAGDADSQKRLGTRLKIAAALTLAFVLLEFSGGILSHSLAVISDATQNFIDALSLLLVWWSQGLSTRPADNRRTFGYQRANILVALLNSVFIGLAVIDIGWHAVLRFLHPIQVDSTFITFAGAAGLTLNIIIALLLRSNSDKLHVRGAYLHTISDILASAMLLVSGVIIHYTGAYWVDLLMAAGICTAVIWTMVPVASKAVHILLEGAPDGVDNDEIVATIGKLPNVTQVHDLHTWTHADGMAAVTCHVCIQKDVPHDQDHILVDQIRQLLRTQFGLTHSTIQVEHSSCEQRQKCVWRSESDKPDQHHGHNH